MSHGPKLGQASKPILVTLIAQVGNRSLSLEHREGKFLCLFVLTVKYISEVYKTCLCSLKNKMCLYWFLKNNNMNAHVSTP